MAYELIGKNFTPPDLHAKVTGKALPAAVIEGAWQNLAFTVDPIAASLRKSAADAAAVGLLETTLAHRHRAGERAAHVTE